jgi:hypothetical protein
MKTISREELLVWLCQNYKEWPAPNTFIFDGPDISHFGCRWTFDPYLSSLPIVWKNDGSFRPITSVDYFYRRIRNGS